MGAARSIWPKPRASDRLSRGIGITAVMRYLSANAAIVRLAVAVVIVGASSMPVRPQSASLWTVPEIGALPRDAHGLAVREGRDLITATYAYIGPDDSDVAER